MSAFDLAATKAQLKEPEDYYRQHSFKVYLWSDLWRKIQGPQAFDWSEVAFEDGSVDAVPMEPGIYAFKIAIRDTIMPEHSVIVYFGQSGAGSDGKLRKRFKQYLQGKKRGAKRILIDRLFRTWPDDLVFCYAALDCTEDELLKLENDLSDAAIPMCSTMDFSAHVRRIVPVLRS